MALSDLLKEARELRSQPIKEKIAIMDPGNLRSFFQASLSEEIIKGADQGTDIYLCSTYISSLLATLGSREVTSWYVVDYFLEGQESPFVIRDGADVCFLICSLFPERGNRRSMKIKDYEDLGKGMYSSCYSSTGNWIFSHMSNKFNTMTRLTKEAFKEMQL